VSSAVGAAASCVQPVSLLRDRAQDLSGLSPTRWRLAAGSSASWMGYGWLQAQPTVWLSAAVGLGCSLVVCGFLLRRRPVRPAAELVPLPRWVPAETRMVLATAA
jgi:hypothetical protein